MFTTVTADTVGCVRGKASMSEPGEGRPVRDGSRTDKGRTTMRDSNDRRLDQALGFSSPEEPLDVSIILPAYNEVDSVDGVYDQVVRVLDATGWSYEIVFVDDGSTDGTWQKLRAIAAEDQRVRLIKHRRNFGKASALANGFSYSRGDIMVTSDADMQYEPQDIVRLIDKVREGSDVVSAYKVLRRDPLSKRIPSKFFNFFVRSTTGVELHDFNAGLKAFRHEAADDLVKYGYGELHRFFMLLAARQGYSVAEVPVESCFRKNGQSKYGMERYARGALDYLTVVFLSGYQERPLHFFGPAGLVLSVLATLSLAVGGFLSLFGGEGASAMPFVYGAGLLFMTGLQLLVFGLIAEMINNLERSTTAGSKISEVFQIDRRTSVLSPGVTVERRGTRRPRAGGRTPETLEDEWESVAEPSEEPDRL